MIERLAVSNFRSIRQQTLVLGRVNVFIGQNGAGKSNFVSIFTFLEKLTLKELAAYIDRKGGFDELVYGGLETSSTLALDIALTDENAGLPAEQYSCFLRAVGTNYRIARESLFVEVDTGYNITSTAGGQETALFFSVGADPIITRAMVALSRYLGFLRVYHFHDTSDNARVKLPQDVGNGYYLQSEAENLAPFLYNLQQNHPAAYTDIVATVQLVYPLFADFFLQESSARDKMELRWRERDSEALLSARQLSDGTLRFMCLATLLLQPPPADLPDAPRTLVLDEPELGLHPFALHVLAELLHKAAVHRQVIVATQSVGLLNYFTPEDLLIVERGPEGDTVFSRKTSDELQEWLRDYTLGQLWEANLLGGRP